MHLCADMYILKLFKKRHDFARLILAFEKFQEMGTESIAFQLVIFQYLKKTLDQNISLIPLWNNN